MDSLIPSNNTRDIYTVSRLNMEARDLLAAQFPLIWLEAEISNLARPASGHLYFSLKDARAQVRCAMFKGRNRSIAVQPENGMQVLVRASVSLYEPRGDYQLIVEHMEPAGEGALRAQFEALKKKLAAEGLFDDARKKPLPSLPNRIGVITSPSGAAIRDILSVLQRRFPAIPVLIYPVPVQGEGSAGIIADTIQLADERKDCDILILARGGGSLEDLWSFNEEVVARAVAACELPIVCGVGHEIDFSIADFVADQRAPTPSVAAEMVSPNQIDMLNLFRAHEQRLRYLFTQQQQQLTQQLDWFSKRLQQLHPGHQLAVKKQRQLELQQRLQRAILARVRQGLARTETLTAQLYRHHPGQQLARFQARQEALQQRLMSALKIKLHTAQQQLHALARTLDTVSPLATLDRGYAIVSDSENGTILRSVTDTAVGNSVRAKLKDGELRCQVKEIIEENK